MAIPQVSEFDIMRQRIKEREQERGKQAGEAVKHQFASRGMLQSGAQIKAQERAAQDVATQAREERRDVLIAEADVRRREREAQLQREFITGERLGAQQFASGEREAQQRFASAEAALGRSFTTSEREAMQGFQAKLEQGRQDFTTQERQAAQLFASAEAAAQRQFAAGESALQRSVTTDMFARQMLEQQAARQQNATQFNQEMELNRQNSRINAMTALKNAGFSDADVNRLIGDVLGIGGGAGVDMRQGAVNLPGLMGGTPQIGQIQNVDFLGSQGIGNISLPGLDFLGGVGVT